MNERMTQELMAKARSSFEPTAADRDRMRKKVMTAVGAGAVVTAAATAVGAGSGFLSGIPPLAVTVLKLSVVGLLVGGATAFAVMGRSGNDNTVKPAHVVIIEPHSSSSGTEVSPPSIEPATLKQLEALPPAPLFETPFASVDPSKPQDKNTTKRPSAAPMQDAATETPNDDGLLKEISIIKSASKAMSHGDPKQAMQFIDTYDAEFPSGVMRQERDALAVLAMCNMGHLEEAKLAEERFKQQYPNAPLAIRVDENCGSLNEQK